MSLKKLFKNYQDIRCLNIRADVYEAQTIDNVLYIVAGGNLNDNNHYKEFSLLFDLVKLSRSEIPDIDAILEFTKKYGLPFLDYRLRKNKFMWGNLSPFGFNVEKFIEETRNIGKYYTKIIELQNYSGECLSAVWQKSNFDIRPFLDSKRQIRLELSTDNLFNIAYYYLILIASSDQDYIEYTGSEAITGMYRTCKFPGCNRNFRGTHKDNYCSVDEINGIPTHNKGNAYWHRNKQKYSKRSPIKESES